MLVLITYTFIKTKVMDTMTIRLYVNQSKSLLKKEDNIWPNSQTALTKKLLFRAVWLCAVDHTRFVGA